MLIVVGLLRGKPPPNMVYRQRCSFPQSRASTGPEAELPMHVDNAGAKGQGAFAATEAYEGTWVCAYAGERLQTDQISTRYSNGVEPEYLFHVVGDIYIDGHSSGHASRYFNHAQNGTLRVEVDEAEARIDFFLARDVSCGEELTFDYGEDYWYSRKVPPAPGTDERDFTQRHLASWAAPPPGPRPLTPLNAAEMAMLPIDANDARAALLRSLEYFGAERRAWQSMRAHACWSGLRDHVLHGVSMPSPRAAPLHTSLNPYRLFAGEQSGNRLLALPAWAGFSGKLIDVESVPLEQLRDIVTVCINAAAQAQAGSSDSVAAVDGQ